MEVTYLLHFSYDDFDIDLYIFEVMSPHKYVRHCPLLLNIPKVGLAYYLFYRYLQKLEIREHCRVYGKVSHNLKRNDLFVLLLSNSGEIMIVKVDLLPAENIKMVFGYILN